MNRKIVLLMMGCLSGASLVGCSHGKTPAANAGAGAAAPTVSTAAPAGAAPATSATPQGTAAGAPAQPDLVLLAGAAFDGCKAPTAPPDPPDGNVATKAQMLSSHQLTADFNAATNAYLACLDQASNNFDRQYGRGMPLSSLQDVVAIHDRIHNRAVDTDKAVADKFNRQLRAYKARGGAT